MGVDSAAFAGPALLLALGAHTVRGRLPGRAVLGVGPGGLRLARLATGNLLAAIAVIGVAGGGWPLLLCAGTTVGAMRLLGRE